MFNQIYTLLLVSFFLTGCASAPHFLGYQSTDELINNHQYQKALDRINAESPIDQVLLLKVKKLADTYQQKQINKINLLVKQKQWGEARSILNNLYPNQPHLATYSSLKAKIDSGQKEEERLINTERALLNVQLLSVEFDQLNLSERINYGRTRWFFLNDDLDSKKQALAEELLYLSTQALLVKDYLNAQKTYEQAIKLDPNLGEGEITYAINAGLSQQNNRAINERQKSLIQQLNRAIKRQDYKSLIAIQAILSNEIFSGPEVNRALNKAKRTRHEHAYKLDEIASKEYRQGNISSAVTQWKKALKLMPGNISIQEKLIRAQKVQRKLEKLTNKETSATD